MGALFLNTDFLDQQRLVGDPQADSVVADLFKSNFNPLKEERYQQFRYNHQAVPDEFPDSLKRFFDSIAAPVEQKIVEKGSTLFQDHAQELMAVLGLLSLPYCYAAANGAQVLYLSERIYNSTAKRLTETAQFVFDVCEPQAFESKGKAFRSIAKVRLMHAAIRYHILNSGKWNSSWGHPINQEDMAATNLTFSFVALEGLKKLGVPISIAQANDYIRYWNIIGERLGIQPEFLPKDNLAAFRLDKKISKHQFAPSQAGKVLTKALVDYFNSQKSTSPLPLEPEKLMAYLLGKEVAETLGLSYSTKYNSIKPLGSIRSILGLGNKANYFQSRAQFDRYKQHLSKAEFSPFELVQSLTD